MESVTGDDNFGKHGQELADKTADKLQSGIRSAKDAANRAGDKLSEGVENVRSSSGQFIGKAADQAQTAASRAMGSLNAATQTVRATASDVGDSVVSYTRDNPVTTILISAAVGALIATVVNALLPSRD
jgi:ElaB/YqjD/DUF883 family membrane-anchored ribosome-binding protein